MFVRVKPVGLRKYIQIVESRREDGAVKQRVLGTLGRLDRLQADGVIDGLVKSLSRFALRVRLVEGQKSGRLRAGRVVKVGPAAVVERLWRDLGLARVIEDELRGRGFEFPVERAVFLTVLHRLFASGSDRACEKWKRDHRVRDVDGLELHHLYRAMAWLGTNKDAVERSLGLDPRVREPASSRAGATVCPAMSPRSLTCGSQATEAAGRSRANSGRAITRTRRLWSPRSTACATASGSRRPRSSRTAG